MILLHGDCLKKMKTIPDGSVDMVLTDPPYGTTSCKWDTIIPLEQMWFELRRISKPNAAIVLFGKNPFTAQLLLSNREMYRYELIWEKTRAGNCMQVKKQPSAIHENILVFYRDQPTYNDLKFQVSSKYIDKRKSIRNSFYKSEHYNGVMTRKKDDGSRHPQSVLPFNSVWKKGMHPTEKPVELCEWLIRTYTNETDTVLDFTMGSGTTGVACKHHNRNFIGIEKNDDYFGCALERLKSTPLRCEFSKLSMPVAS